MKIFSNRGNVDFSGIITTSYFSRIIYRVHVVPSNPVYCNV